MYLEISILFALVDKYLIIQSLSIFEKVICAYRDTKKKKTHILVKKGYRTYSLFFSRLFPLSVRIYINGRLIFRPFANHVYSSVLSDSTTMRGDRPNEKWERWWRMFKRYFICKLTLYFSAEIICLSKVIKWPWRGNPWIHNPFPRQWKSENILNHA